MRGREERGQRVVHITAEVRESERKREGGKKEGREWFISQLR